VCVYAGNRHAMIQAYIMHVEMYFPTRTLSCKLSLPLVRHRDKNSNSARNYFPPAARMDFNFNLGNGQLLCALAAGALGSCEFILGRNLPGWRCENLQLGKSDAPAENYFISAKLMPALLKGSRLVAFRPTSPCIPPVIYGGAYFRPINICSAKIAS
jgi:hypothetical protein